MGCCVSRPKAAPVDQRPSPNESRDQFPPDDEMVRAIMAQRRFRTEQQRDQFAQYLREGDPGATPGTGVLCKPPQPPRQPEQLSDDEWHSAAWRAYSRPSGPRKGPG